MPNNFCLGISGQMRSGKDTVCEMIRPLLDDATGRKFERVSFADAVKGMLCAFSYREKGKTISVTREWIEENKVKSDFVPEGWGMNVRSALINIGDRFREICPTVWIDIAMRRGCDKIISDVRYQNEAEMINEDPRGFVVRVRRPSRKTQVDDPSETSLLKFDSMFDEKFEGPTRKSGVPFDFMLLNDGNLDDLEVKVRTLLLPRVLDRWIYFTSGSAR